MSNKNRTRKPDAASRAYVAGLIDHLGLVAAARVLELSPLATLNVAAGGDCYAVTLRRVQHKREALAA